MDFLRDLINPQTLANGGYALLFLIVFAETGLLIGFFLPGDSLLFVAGALAAVPATSHLNIAVLIPLLCVAAIVGDAVGYLIGRKLGPALFSREDSRFFKRAHLQKTQAFYEKHGPKTIVMARFVPIVRTFAPTVAGAAGMNYKSFATYNVLGGCGWVFICCLLGYFLGNIPAVKNNFEKAVILIVLLSILPIFIHWLQERKAGNRDAALSATTTIAEEN
ncbi:MAG TPA: VTT domain-containing protein [Abditibacteriaceae bacterium]|nr:VTT domain-containing protein [Abditibacteriaceae bacterium]